MLKSFVHTPLPIRTILDASDERLSMFHEQSDRILAEKGWIIVDSEKVVKRALMQGIDVFAILADQAFYRDHTSLLQARLDGDCKRSLFQCPHAVATSLVGHRLHRGIMALAKRPTDFDIDTLSGPVVILNGVNNAENVGLICRSALAFGFQHIILDERSCSAWLRRSIRVSMGSVFKLRFLHCGKRSKPENTKLQISEVLDRLMLRGYRLVSLDPNQKAIDLDQCELPRQSMLVVGCEGDGIHQELISKSHASVKIPMAEGIDSLNVAHAFSIAAYEWHRQHRNKSMKP